MGDEAQESGGDQQYGAPVEQQYPEQQYPEQQPDASGDGGDGSSAASHGPDVLGEDLFNQLGQMFAAGDYPGAIARIEPLVTSESPSNPYWGRAAYGLVMCYDRLARYADASGLMWQIIQFLPPSDQGAMDQYQAQARGYDSGHPWTGDFLLV